MSEQRKIVRVGDVMKRGVDVVDGMATVADALREAKHPETKCLVVRKRNDNDEYGIVTYADIAKLVLAQNRAPERVNIYEIMTKPVVTVRPEMDIRYCARLFGNQGPVLKSGEVLGIVGYTDMVLHGLLPLPEGSGGETPA